MRIAVVGSDRADSQLIDERMCHYVAKLRSKPVVLFTPPADFLSQWCFAHLVTYQVYHEGLQAMLTDADALIVFGNALEARRAVRQAEAKGIKIKRVP